MRTIWSDPIRRRWVVLGVVSCVILLWFLFTKASEFPSTWMDLSVAADLKLGGNEETELSITTQWTIVEDPGPLDLNLASAAELQRLPGIGPSKAAAIVAYREQLGYFSNVDELVEVNGIGRVTLEALREFVMVVDSDEESSLFKAADLCENESACLNQERND